MDAALSRGLQILSRCASLGCIEGLMTAQLNAAAFANVALDLRMALAQLDVGALGCCDDFTVMHVALTLEQLAKVQAPFPEAQQQMMIQLRKLAEAKRIQEQQSDRVPGASPAAKDLREMAFRAVNGFAPDYRKTDLSTLLPDNIACVWASAEEDTLM
jgi:hypothetical protein